MKFDYLPKYNLLAIDDEGFPISIPIEMIQREGEINFKLPQGLNLTKSKTGNIHVRAVNIDELYFKSTILEGSIHKNPNEALYNFIVENEVQEIIETQNNLISQLISTLPEGKKRIEKFSEILLNDILYEQNRGLLIINIANNVHVHQINCIPASLSLKFEIASGNKLNHVLRYVTDGTIVFDKTDKSLDNIALVGDILFESQLLDSEVYNFEPMSMMYGNQSKVEYVKVQSQSLFDVPKFSKKFILKSKYWYNLMRLPLLLFSLIPLLVGTVIADPHQGNINTDLLFLEILAVLFFQGAANLLNDYFDHKSDSDEYALIHTKLNAGSRFLQLRLINEEQIKNYSIFSIIIGSIVGLYINLLIGGFQIILIGLSGALIILSYNLPPAKLSYRWYGDIVFAFLIFPLILIGSSFVQVLDYENLIESISIGVSMACFVIAILFVGNIMSYDAEKAANKTTFTVKFGKENTIKSILVFLLANYLIELVLFSFQGDFWLIIPISASLTIALLSYKLMKSNLDDIINLERGYRLLVYAFLTNYVSVIVLLAV